jgi:hypothetical protein
MVCNRFPPYVFVPVLKSTYNLLYRRLSTHGSCFEPGKTKPGTIKPGTTKPGTTKPGTTNPRTTKPGTTKQGMTKTGTTLLNYDQGQNGQA